MSGALQRGTFGLVAGGGIMPLRIADAAAKAGRRVFCILIQGHALPEEFAAYTHEVVPLAQIGRMVALLKAHGVGDMVLAGRVNRPSLAMMRFDADGLRFVARLGKRALFGGDDGLLSAVVGLLREEGFNPLGAQEVLGALLVEPGVLGAVRPDAQALADIARGIAVTQALGAVDVGQGCIVQQGLVLGVEAIEGTDSLIARCGPLRREGPGGVLVKLVKPRQDLRVDLPSIGAETVRGAAAAGLAGIAIEARGTAAAGGAFAGTLVVDREETVAAADAAGLFLLALRPHIFLAEQEQQA
jgi:DUF1009 family protein